MKLNSNSEGEREVHTERRAKNAMTHLTLKFLSQISSNFVHKYVLESIFLQGLSQTDLRITNKRPSAQVALVLSPLLDVSQAPMNPFSQL